jgi:hypothetical protein
MNDNFDESKPGYAPPPRGEVATVLCAGYKHLAYRDWRGHWRSFTDCKPLEGHVRVIDCPQGPPRGHIQLNLFRNS